MALIRISAGLLLAAGQVTAQSRPCASPTAAQPKGPHFFIEAVKPVVRDSLVTARLCLIPNRAGVGSYTALLTFDTLEMRAVRADVQGGLQAANVTVPGSVRLAGASPAGFPRGPLASIAFRPSRGKVLGMIKVTLSEANTIAGASVLGGSRVTGFPASNKTLGVVQVGTTPLAGGESARRTPHIDSISPPMAKVDAEIVTDLVLYGRNFSASGNVVLFDAAPVEGLLSESGGTVIRFNAPTIIPARGSAPARRVGPGRIDVRVRTPAGTSNAVPFMVQGGNR